MVKARSSKHVIAVLQDHEFHFFSQKGSHGKFKCGSRRVIVPMNKQNIPAGTMSSIIRQSGLPKELFD